MDLRVPNLGEGADSGVVVNLMVKEGEVIAQGQPLVELENEKAIAPIPSTSAGAVTKIYVKVGDKISVGQRILALAVEGEAPGEAASPVSPPPVEAAPLAAALPRTRPAMEPVAEEALGEAEPAPGGPAPSAAPSIRRLARELGIDLNKVRASERGGRIVMADLRAYIQRLQRLATQAQPVPSLPAKPKAEPIDFAKWGPVTIKPLSPLRLVIARRMTDNYLTIPHVTQFDEADVTALMELRKKYQAPYEQRGARLTLTSFVFKAVANVLQRHPIFNASLDATEENVVFKSYYHLGMATDTEAGLIVPVLRDADKKSLLELSRDIEELARKARERKVSADELKGGTFTISNQGGIGGAHFTPIINKPEVAILGLGRGVVKPMWKNGQVEPRTLVPLVVSYDHRVIDGGAAARFVVDLVQALGNFDEAQATP
jgi:pyruvate dehydrogenase E2 component (dihydrolipoamide acetyltransferase)